MVVIAQDATPVYLDASTGKILVRASLLKELRLRRVAKKLVEQGRSSTLVQLTGISKPSDAEGSSRREKNRLTFIMRQSLHNLLDPAELLFEGRIRDGVLLCHATRHARLEDMSFAEPSYWLRTHSVEMDGKLQQRKDGEKVWGSVF